MPSSGRMPRCSFRACIQFHAVSFMEFIFLYVPLLVSIGALAYTLTDTFCTSLRLVATVYYTNDVGVWREGPVMPFLFWCILFSLLTRRRCFVWVELLHMHMHPGVLSLATPLAF